MFPEHHFLLKFHFCKKKNVCWDRLKNNRGKKVHNPAFKIMKIVVQDTKKKGQQSILSGSGSTINMYTIGLWIPVYMRD